MSNQSNELRQLYNLLLWKAITIGICGGIIGSAFFLFMFTFNMIEVDPFLLLQLLFTDSPWLSKWYAYFILIIAYVILSMLIAIVYYIFLKRKNSWLIGACYGVFLWVIVYWILPLTVKGFNSFIHFEAQSHIAMLSLLLLYGVFIGYSISYDYKALKIEREKHFY